MSTITTLAALRDRVGSAHPELAEKNIDYLDDFARTFISLSPFIVLSTADESGNIDASPKGDGPGFVEVVDDHTLLIPDRPGNKLAYGHENILTNPRVGILFMLPGTRETLRVNGRAELPDDVDVLERLAARDKAALLAIRVTVQECFFHCGKAFLRSGLWQPDTWQPRHKVSFGEMFAAHKVPKRQLDDDDGPQLARDIDQAIAADYRENL